MAAAAAAPAGFQWAQDPWGQWHLVPYTAPARRVVGELAKLAGGIVLLVLVVLLLWFLASNA